MRKVLGVLAILSMLAVGTVAAPLTGDILGAWVNVDPDSGGLGQLTITPNEWGGLRVWGYGVCDPDFCEWGAADLYSLDYDWEVGAEVGVAIWPVVGQTIVLKIHMVGEVMAAEVFYLYEDGTQSGMAELALLRQVF